MAGVNKPCCLVDRLTYDIDRPGIPPDLLLPQYDEDCQRLLGSCFVRVLQSPIQEILDCAIEAVVLVFFICCFDVCTRTRLKATRLKMPHNSKRISAQVMAAVCFQQSFITQTVY